MFDHEMFDKYDFEDIPLDRDLYVLDAIFLEEYEASMLRFFGGAEWEPVGYVSPVAARKVNKESIELSWYANVFDRFHEVAIVLPRDQFITCVGSLQCDEKPYIFVKSDWIENIYLRSYSIFALVDAICVINALENGKITREKLIELRCKIDALSEKYPDISFISFADSLLLKSNWSVGHFKSNVKYTYEPEIFLHLADEINCIYKATLGLGTYTIISQGSNEYYDDPLLHISESKNHISLNSLGVPFAQLMAIDSAARKAIQSKVHPRADLYMDEQYFHSLKYKHGFDKNAEPSNTYQTKMMGKLCKYYYSTANNMLNNIEFSE